MRSKQKQVIGFFLLFSFLLSVGAYFPVLQGIAWTGMFVRNAQALPLKKAVKQTFDGRHLCAICLHLRKVYRRDRQSLSNKIEFGSQKLDAVPAAQKRQASPVLPQSKMTFIDLSKPQNIELTVFTPPPRSRS